MTKNKLVMLPAVLRESRRIGNRNKTGVLCAVLLLSACFTGCGDREVKAAEPLVVDVYDSLSDYEGMQEGWYASLLREKFNIELRFLTQEEKQKMDLLEVQEKDAIPDLIIYSGEEGDLQKIVEADNLYNMEDLLEGTEIAEYKDALKALNGPAAEEGIYAVPGEVSRLAPETPSESLVPEYGFYVRWDVYKQAGYHEVGTMEELLDVMEEMQEILRRDGQQDVYAISLYRDERGSFLDHVSQIAGIYGYGRRGFVFARSEDKKYQDISDRDSWFGEACEWLREAYERGLVDPGSFTQTKEEADRKYAEGKAFLTIYPETGVRYSSSSGSLPEGQGLELAPVKGMKVLSRGCNQLGRQDQFLALGRGIEDPERMMEFLNWFYSPEGIMISGTGKSGGTAGIQGLTWDMEEGNPVLTEYGEKVFRGEEHEVPGDLGGGTWQEGICRLSFRPVAEVEVCPSGFTYSYELWDTVEEAEGSSLKQDWKEFMQADDAIEYLMKGNQLKVVPGYPELQEEEPADITGHRTECLKLLESYFPRLIKAGSEQEFDSIYREMTDKMQLKGYTDVLQYDLELLEKQKQYREKTFF